MSSRPVVLRAAAAVDVEKAVDHYVAEAGEDIALGFIDAYEKAIARLARHPSSGSSRYAHIVEIVGLRCLALARYPFLIFYVAGDERIDVWRVLHAQSDIPAWISEGGDQPYS